MIYAEDLWLGTETSLGQFHESLAKISEMPADTLQAYMGGGKGRAANRLLSIDGDLARISVKGPLINSDFVLLNMFMGATGYPEIREALVEAATNQKVKHILLDVDSPGGQVSGIADTADLVSQINENVKPIDAFTDGSMASAAYWLGVGARSITATKTANVGSIGVIMTHMERSRQLEQAGIKATVIRSGRYKQLGNPAEPLTEEGKAELQALADSTYEVFLSHVAQNRGKPVDFVRTSMAEGRVFVGANALHAGLVDEISGFDSLMSKLADKVDKPKNINENKHLGATTMNKKALTAAAIAALAEGVQDPEAIETPDQVDAAAAAAVDAETQVTADEANEAGATATEDSSKNVEKENSTVAAEPSGVEALLQSQLNAANEALIDAKVEFKALKAQFDALTEATDSLVKIAQASIGNMQVALGGSRTTLEGMSAAETAAMHARLATDFQARFKAGGVAAATADQQEKPKVPKRDSLTAAQLAAANLR